MPRCLRGSRGPPEGEPVPQGLKDFWSALSLADRRRLLRVDKKALFQRIRTQYCSRCFGLFAMRYDELRGSAALDCPACMEFYSGLVVTDGQLTLEEKLVHTEPGPFAAFAEAHMRERERELQFMTGDICGSGWQKRPGVTMCALHTSPVPYEAIAEYWHGLPEDHQTALFRLREEDFCAELDAHLKYQLRICRDCRGNVLKAFKELRPTVKKGATPTASPAAHLEVCEGHRLTVADGLVSVEGTSNASAFFERAEEVEENKAADDAELGDEYDNPEHVRHAETPELAREALIDSVVLIYKSQVEVAFREQTAGHNALLLFVHLALGMMEEQVLNEYKELEARRAEAELLDLVAKEEEKKESRKAKRKAKKAAKQPGLKGEDGCSECAALQSCSAPSSPRTPLSPRSLSPLHRSPSPPAPPQDKERCPDPSTAAHPTHPPTSTPGSPAAPAPQADSPRGGWEVQSAKRKGTPGSAPASRKAQPLAEAAHPVLTLQEHPLQAHAAVQMPVLHRASSSSAASASSAPAVGPTQSRTAAVVAAKSTSKEHRPQQTPTLAPWAAAVQAQHQQQWRQEQCEPEWTPMGGRCVDLGGLVGLGIAAAGKPGDNKTPQEADKISTSHTTFSLFHHSPASPRKMYATKGPHSLQQNNVQELRAYQLFGASQGPHPLAPLLRVPF